jgi:alpha-N-arabinofuranosidase
VEESLEDWARRGANRVRCKAEAWDEYLKRFPAIKQKKVYVSIDEWSCGAGAGIKTNLSIAWMFQEMFRHSDFIKMAAHTMGPASVIYNRTEAQMNSTGLVFDFYKKHYGTLPVDVAGNSPQPAPKWPVGGDQPKVNAGSETYPLDVVAAWSADRKTLTVAIVNPTEVAHAIDLQFKGVALRGQGKVWRMTGQDLNAVDAMGKKPTVDIAESAVSEAPRSLTIAPASITIYAMEKQ